MKQILDRQLIVFLPMLLDSKVYCLACHGKTNKQYLLCTANLLDPIHRNKKKKAGIHYTTETIPQTDAQHNITL